MMTATRKMSRRREMVNKTRWLAVIAGAGMAGATVAAMYSPNSAENAEAVNAVTVASETAAVTSAAAPAPVAGVQDGWINSCDADPYRPLLPGQVDSTHKHRITVTVRVTVKGKTVMKAEHKWVPYADHSVAAVDSPYWRRLDMTTVRWSPTWDIAYQNLSGQDAVATGVERACFGYWLGRLAAHGVSAEIAFKPDYCYKNSSAPSNCANAGKGGQVVIPTLGVYAAAIKAFLTAYPQVKIIAPWGEPDFQPSKAKLFRIGNDHGANFGGASCPKKATDLNCGPVLAARMWVTVREQCPSCTVIAGDFGSSKQQNRAYLGVYHRYLRDPATGHAYRPAVWAIHPYTDMTTWEWEISHHTPLTAAGDTLVASFASWLKADGYHSRTRIWLDEVSSFTVPPYGHSTYSREVQAKASRLLFTRLPLAGSGNEPRVTRIYYMRFAGAAHDALIVGGKRQQIYWSVANRPKPVPAAAATTTEAVPPAVARYEIRNAAGDLCLDANDLGASAGQNGDKVQLWTCYAGANQEWIPRYQSGQLAWLVSAKYPGMCLNASNIAGLANGRRVQLWNCYNAPNELWNVGALAASMHDAPLFLGNGGSQSLALDANKYHLGNSDKVQVWAYYAGSSQLWSLLALR